MKTLPAFQNLKERIPAKWRAFIVGCMIPFAAVSITAAPLPLTLRGIAGLIFIPMFLLDVVFQWLGAPVSILSDTHPRKAWLIGLILFAVMTLIYGLVGMLVAPLFRKVPATVATTLGYILIVLSLIGVAYLAMESTRYI